MTKEAKEPTAVAVPPTRDDIRAKILGYSGKPKSELITFFDQTIELRQPTVGEIEELQNQSEHSKGRTVRTLIRYAYVPGTDEKVFDEADVDGLQELPWGKDFSEVVKAVAKLTGIDIGGAEKN